MGNGSKSHDYSDTSTPTVEVLGQFAPHPYQSLDPDGRIITINDAWLDTLGYDRPAAEGAWFGDFLTEDSVAVFESRFDESSHEDGVTSTELEIERADGEVIRVRFDGAVEYDEDGSMVRTHCQFVDITEERERLATIRRLSEYRRVVSAVDSVLVKTDDVPEMLRRTTDIIAESELFGCTFLALVDDLETEFVCESGTVMEASDVREFHPTEYVTEVFENGTLRLPDVTEPPYRQHIRDQPSHPGFAVAIEAGGTQYGILTVHFDPADEPERTEVELLERLADDIGMFLRNDELERERERHAETVAKRERLFRELHTITRDLLAAGSESEIYTELVDGLAESLSGGRFAVFRFDDTEGVLELHEPADTIYPEAHASVRITPRDRVLWEVYQDGRPRFIEPGELSSALSTAVLESPRTVALSLGDYGLLVAAFEEGPVREDIDLEMLKLCTANAEAILGRNRRDRELGTLSAEIDRLETRVDELRASMDSVGTIQEAIAGSETRPEMEEAVCKELVASGFVDFAWFGGHESSTSAPSPIAWAGEASEYVDYLRQHTDAIDTPASQATESRETVYISNISREVRGSDWAKKALSAGLQSAISIPIVHDGVLYGVLSAFSGRQADLEDTRGQLLEGVASMLGAYLEMHTIRLLQTDTETIELEFEITDGSFPMGHLAAETGATLRFVALLGTDADTVRYIIDVDDGDAERVRKQAQTMAQIRSARRLGDATSRKLVLEVERPCLVTQIGKHGARLGSAVADRTEATVRLTYPANIPVRPLFERLQTLYSDIELVAKRERPDRATETGFTPEEALTVRQLEILKAAFFGGYYDTPREISGEELAASFDISNSAVSKHLRAAQRQLLSHLFDSVADNQGLNDEH